MRLPVDASSATGRATTATNQTQRSEATNAFIYSRECNIQHNNQLLSLKCVNNLRFLRLDDDKWTVSVIQCVCC